MAAIYGRELLGTYHERMVAPPWPEDFRERPPGGLWARGIGYGGHKDGEGEGLDRTATYDLAFGAVQVGLDVLREERDAGQRDRAGAYAAFGRADADVTHSQSDGSSISAGDTSFDAVSLGGYWTRTGPEGWYVDGVLQLTWYDVKMLEPSRGRQRQHRRVGARRLGRGRLPLRAPGRMGGRAAGTACLPDVRLRRLRRRRGQGQLQRHPVLLAGRLGARLARSWEQGTEDAPRPAAAWARVNVWQEFLANPTTTFSAFGGSVPFTGSLDDTWAEIESAPT